LAFVTFYFDRSAGRAFPDALNILRLPVEHQSYHFAADTKDDVWLSKVGERKWYVLSYDRKFLRYAAEKAAIKQFSIGCFILWGAQATRWEKMQCFVRGYDRMMRVIETKERPFMYSMDRRGNLRKAAIT
jgi:hypothetical protein